MYASGKSMALPSGVGLSQKVDVRGLAPGLYLLLGEGIGGAAYTGRLVVE